MDYNIALVVRPRMCVTPYAHKAAAKTQARYTLTPIRLGVQTAHSLTPRAGAARRKRDYGARAERAHIKRSARTETTHPITTTKLRC